MTVEKSKNHSAAFSFPMIPEQMVFIWGTLFLCLFSWQRCHEGQKACWDISMTTCLQIILIHVMMRWESEGDHRRGNGKDPIGLFHVSHSTLPGRTESLDRRCTGRSQPNIPVVWKLWRYDRNLNWSHEAPQKPCGQRKRAGFTCYLGVWRVLWCLFYGRWPCARAKRIPSVLFLDLWLLPSSRISCCFRK